MLVPQQNFNILPIELTIGKGGTSQYWIFSNQVEHLEDADLSASRCSIVWSSQLQRLGIYCKRDQMSLRLFSHELSHQLSLLISMSSSKPNTGSWESFVKCFSSFFVALSIKKQKLIQNFTRSIPSAFRLLHGENDGIPGIVIDVYGNSLVLSCGSPSGDFLLPLLVESLEAAFPEHSIYERSSGQNRQMLGLPERTRLIRKIHSFEDATDDIRVEFAGLSLKFQPLKAQKTGLFLDQRHNLDAFQKFLELNSKPNRSMLDICCYVGPWASSAAKSGVTSVTLIDQDRKALDSAAQNVTANSGVDKSLLSIETMHLDFFEGLSKLKSSGKCFDIVVCDPPAFAKSKAHVAQALRAYQKLFRLGAELLKPEGILVVCSCSRNILEDDFLLTLNRAVSHLGNWQVLYKGMQSLDHTRLLESTYGDYLKCFFLQRN